ncbi:bumetanide-sensitive sodium-(potassium)-chloride cotransporter-like isoform X3 [Oppia nitens]|uniref:bumetanide-sensitive sodium-(potassium)-chloride cotransporter-like isoform X3 n=1 Tax=Oppia nitens TaxID=1686743 RepID=UPI0023DC743F|nr:bumetanide-sensitive sodium-(potassium)-chloride cotransporter-like isoform X3 [Oppia nitens]
MNSSRDIPFVTSGGGLFSRNKLRYSKKYTISRNKWYLKSLCFIYFLSFRIGYSDVIVIADIHKPPQESTIREFDALISKWRVKESSDNTTNNCDPNTGDHNNTNDSDSNRSSNQLVITEDEVIALKDKNKRHMRLRELLCQYSRQSSLIVMTLPMPRKGTCSAPMYMSWLELLTQDMPPFMFIRGDQTNVLTFYS